MHLKDKWILSSASLSGADCDALSLSPLGLLLLQSQNTWVGALIKSQIFHAMRQAAQRDDDGAVWKWVWVSREGGGYGGSSWC